MKAKTHCLLSSLVFAAVINTTAKKKKKKHLEGGKDLFALEVTVHYYWEPRRGLPTYASGC